MPNFGISEHEIVKISKKGDFSNFWTNFWIKFVIHALFENLLEPNLWLIAKKEAIFSWFFTYSQRIIR